MNPRNFHTSQKGVTLVELITTVSIISILAAIGLPQLNTMLQNNKMVARNNELLSALNFTRSSAITRGTSTTFCKRNTAGTNCDNSAPWSSGWVVFEDKDSDGNVDTGETILHVYNSLGSSLKLSFGNKNRVVYNNQGFAAGYLGTFVFCDTRGENYKRGLSLSSTGRTRRSTQSDLSNKTCPAN